MPPGFLAVFTEPGDNVSLDEFQDWYEHEHVPLRLNYLSSFLTGTRFFAVDSLCPSWLALYDVDDTSTFGDDIYTHLRASRSLREADLIRRLYMLDRRTYELAYDTGESTLTSSFRSSNPTKVVITHGIRSVDLDLWKENYFWTLRGMEGWVRTRSFRCMESLKIGTGVRWSPEEQNVPKYLVVHELLDLACADAFNANFDKAGLAGKVTEYRTWRLYRAYPSLSQGNIFVEQSETHFRPTSEWGGQNVENNQPHFTGASW